MSFRPEIGIDNWPHTYVHVPEVRRSDKDRTLTKRNSHSIDLRF